MPTVLVVHHTPSPALQEMFEAAVRGARTDEIEGVEVVVRPALTAAAVDVLAADAYLLGTPVRLVLDTHFGVSFRFLELWVRDSEHESHVFKPRA
jgi:hypothetical protein